MAASQITILIISLVAYILLRGANQILADAYLFILFIFSFIISSQSFSMFYLMLFLVAIILDIVVVKINTFDVPNKINVFGMEASGFGKIGISLAVGVLLYVFIIAIGNTVGGNIVGAPDLKITSTSEVASLMKPALESNLGIIENRIAFVLFGVLNAFGLMIPILGLAFQLLPLVLPMMLIGFVMGLFHVAAYGISAGLIIWAALAFMLFIGTTFILKDSLSSDIAHFINNARISLSRGLSIVT